MAANPYKKIAKSLSAAYRRQSSSESKPEASRMVNLAQGSVL